MKRICIPLLLLPICLSGAITWDRATAELTVQPDQDSVSLDFPFRNQGDKPLKILSVVPSCKCTTAVPASTELAPGESDVLHVHINLAGLQGIQEKSVVLSTDDPDITSPRITIRLNILSYVTLSPSLIQWSGAGPRQEKTILCASGAGNSFSIVSVHGALTGLITRVDVLKPGERYMLHLLLEPNAAKGSGTLEIKANVAGAGAHSYFAYVVVK